MKIYFKRIKDSADKGFSLVELIVVCAIIMVVLSMLIPNVIGYIEKAAKMSALNTARVMVNGMEVSTIAHTQEGTVYLNKEYRSEYYDNGKTMKCGFLTNWMLKKAQRNETYASTNLNYADYLIAKDILEAIRSDHSQRKPAMKFTKDARPLGANCKDYCSDGGSAAIFAYAPGGGVYFAQICDKGWLVTYEHGNYTVEKVKSNTTFVGESKLKGS